MVSGRIIKLVVYELLEFVAFSVPTLVIMEKFAQSYQQEQSQIERTHYWLIVSCSIAYVASTTLLIWVPVKVLLYKKRHLYKKIKGWRPVMMMCVVLSTLPSFSFSIATTEVKKHGNVTNLPDSLPDLSVSLVLTSLIVLDIIEKLRTYPLRGTQRIHDDQHIQETTLQNIRTISDGVRQDDSNSVSQQPARRIQVQAARELPEGPQEPDFQLSIWSTLSHRDARAEIFLWSFMVWSDTVEMVRVAGHYAVYSTGWLYPVYIFSYLSLLRVILTPQNPLRNFLGVLLQDVPFFFVRLSLIIALGTITPILGLCKNALVTLSYIYFNYLTKLRPFSTFQTSL
ncbi:transmembrane protein 236 [Suncus etruscus]|uniref:transmembrane protein 236 n=1 Tax=Suncus etruscus TaxID=109475 RepID=UPI00210FF6A0|nr:transmembrane protein 236 [Suncus etruscus]